MTDGEIVDVVKPGDVIDNRYRVERQIGAGGMGVVVAARHLELERRVAIKLLHPTALANPEAVARFSREARAAARIKSEHAVKVVDVGRMADGAPYLVMEHLEGADLAAILEQRGPVPVDLAALYLLQACEALAEAHGLGIVHRDLKSANLFLTRRPDGSPCVKVLDFGISKMTALSDESGTVLTATQSMLGSPAYMSPEQLVSAKFVDARTDIWALGVILYELVTGETPFGGQSMMELFTNIARAPTPVMPAVLPGKLGALVQRCLAKNPADRPQDVAAFAEALAPFAPKSARNAGERVARVLAVATARPATDDDALTLPIGSVSGSAAARTLSPWDTSGGGGRSRVPLLAAGIGAAVVAFGGVGLLVLRLAAPPAGDAPRTGATTLASAPAPSVAPAATPAPTPAEPVVAPVATASAAATAEASAQPSSLPSAAPRAPGARPFPGAKTAPRPAKPRPAGADPFDTRE